MQTSDYYRILQVHYQAEPEIIESAYKRLARKYHPDANPINNRDDRMQLINEAYSILSDPIKRKEYNRTWESKNISSATAANHQSNPGYDSNANSGKRFDRRFLSAKALLEEYFDSLMKGDYSHSYDMISEPDKSNISKSDFIHWQTAVSKVYCIKECKCDLHGIYQDKLIRGTMYGDVLEFNVNTLEHNLVMDMMQKDNVVIRCGRHGAVRRADLRGRANTCERLRRASAGSRTHGVRPPRAALGHPLRSRLAGAAERVSGTEARRRL